MLTFTHSLTHSVTYITSRAPCDAKHTNANKNTIYIIIRLPNDFLSLHAEKKWKRGFPDKISKYSLWNLSQNICQKYWILPWFWSPIKEGAGPHGDSYEQGGQVDNSPESSVAKVVSQHSVAHHYVSGCQSYHSQKAQNSLLNLPVAVKQHKINDTDNKLVSEWVSTHVSGCICSFNQQ